MYGDKVLGCRVAECPTYAVAGVLDDCCETCRYFIVSTPTPRANSTALPSKRNSIYDTMEFMSQLYYLVWITGHVSIVKKFIAWLKWFSELLFVVSVGYSCCGRRWRWPAACRHYHCCLLLLSQKSKWKGGIKISAWCGIDIMIFIFL